MWESDTTMEGTCRTFRKKPVSKETLNAAPLFRKITDAQMSAAREGEASSVGKTLLREAVLSGSERF